MGLHSLKLPVDQVRQPGSNKTALEIDAAAYADGCAVVVECKTELDSGAAKQLIRSMLTIR